MIQLLQNDSSNNEPSSSDQRVVLDSQSSSGAEINENHSQIQGASILLTTEAELNSVLSPSDQQPVIVETVGDIHLNENEKDSLIRKLKLELASEKRKSRKLESKFFVINTFTCLFVLRINTRTYIL